MLKTILSVSGRPGLFKLISNGKNMVIVESLIDKKRLPIYARDKVVSLGDIAMYTTEDEVPLRDVLVSIKKKESGNKASILPSAKPEELKAYLGEVLPNFDGDRIYSSDIKKLINWYNLLTEAGIDFETVESADELEAEETNNTAEAEPKAEKEKVTKTSKTKTDEEKPKKTAASKAKSEKTTEEKPAKKSAANKKSDK